MGALRTVLKGTFTPFPAPHCTLCTHRSLLYTSTTQGPLLGAQANGFGMDRPNPELSHFFVFHLRPKKTLQKHQKLQTNLARLI